MAKAKKEKVEPEPTEAEGTAGAPAAAEEEKTIEATQAQEAPSTEVQETVEAPQESSTGGMFAPDMSGRKKNNRAAGNTPFFGEEKLAPKEEQEIETEQQQVVEPAPQQVEEPTEERRPIMGNISAIIDEEQNMKGYYFLHMTGLRLRDLKHFDFMGRYLAERKFIEKNHRHQQRPRRPDF